MFFKSKNKVIVKDINLFLNLKWININRKFVPKISKKLLKILIIENIISAYSFIRIKKKSWKIQIYCNNNILILHRFIKIITYKKKIYLSIYKLRSLFCKNPGKLFVISTCKGLLTNNSILELGIGGKLLYSITCLRNK